MIYQCNQIVFAHKNCNEARDQIMTLSLNCETVYANDQDKDKICYIIIREHNKIKAFNIAEDQMCGLTEFTKDVSDTLVDYAFGYTAVYNKKTKDLKMGSACYVAKLDFKSDEILQIKIVDSNILFIGRNSLYLFDNSTYVNNGSAQKITQQYDTVKIFVPHILVFKSVVVTADENILLIYKQNDERNNYVLTLTDKKCSKVYQQVLVYEKLLHSVSSTSIIMKVF